MSVNIEVITNAAGRRLLRITREGTRKTVDLRLSATDEAELESFLKDA